MVTCLTCEFVHSIHDGFVFSRVDPAAIDDLPDVEPIAQQVGERADAEPYPTK